MQGTGTNLCPVAAAAWTAWTQRVTRRGRRRCAQARVFETFAHRGLCYLRERELAPLVFDKPFAAVRGPERSAWVGTGEDGREKGGGTGGAGAGRAHSRSIPVLHAVMAKWVLYYFPKSVLVLLLVGVRDVTEAAPFHSHSHTCMLHGSATAQHAGRASSRPRPGVRQGKACRVLPTALP